MDIAVRNLRVFSVLLHEPSLRQAAARLGVGQPALSRQVAKIERLLGVDLIRRSPDGVELTEAGHLLARYAVELNDALDDLIDEVGDVEPGIGNGGPAYGD